MSRSYDVIVLGLGAVGSATAMHLAERGLTVRGFDQYAPPHTLGSSHGRSRIYRQAYFEDARYVPMLLRAFELWRKLERDSQQLLLHTTGALVLGLPGGELVARSAESARQFDLPHQMLDAAELRRRYPVFEVADRSPALLEQNAGYLVPEDCIEQQLRQAQKHGAQLHLNESVIAWDAEPGDAGVTVRTAHGSYSAERLVITAGPWAPQMLADLNLPLRVTRQVLCWFAPEGGVEDFRPDRCPVFLIEAHAGQPLLYGFPLTGSDSEGVKVALHGVEEICTPETVDRKIHPEDEAMIRERLATTVPRLAGRLLHAETCLYTMTPDEHFIIDTHPRHAQVALIAGLSGHGFKFAVVLGEVLADLSMRGKSRFDLRLFALDRFVAASPSLN
jgi:sarcosine oxidase